MARLLARWCRHSAYNSAAPSVTRRPAAFALPSQRVLSDLPLATLQRYSPEAGASRRTMAMATSGNELASNLRGQSCVGMCSRNTPRLSDEAVSQHIAAFPSWELNEGRTMISKRFVAKNYVAAVTFFNAVMELAEKETHHPDLHLTNYRNVQVDMWTHSIGGLALPDFILAAKIDELEVEYSPKWLREQQAKQGGGTA
mmetsp:Transcript_37573/g.94964  ORF Transcript_37573/g.94964 Transcript_37573/m.94964 type:complete len:199 (-) Transcript_37573:241-837(-)